MTSAESLQSLGWRTFFSSQLGDGEERPARVLSVHRSRVELAGDGVPEAVDLSGNEGDIAVGDWVLLDPDHDRIARVLDRFGVFKRRSAGTEARTQLIAANIDTVFIVTSANRDFNIARLERYLALAHEAGAFPVVVITKEDLADDVTDFRADAAGLSPGLLVETLDARDADAVEVLRPWCESGQTVALLGSSGVGKSTLINTLAGTAQDTQSSNQEPVSA